MAARTNVDLGINAQDNASRVIQKVNGEFIKMTDIGAGARDFVRGLGLDFDFLANPAQLAGDLLLKVGSYVKDSVGEFAAYGKEVGDVARQLGVSAEEASLLIQVADDLEISFESLQLGLRQAQQKGFTPTLEGLKSIRKEYIALKDPTEQAAFAMDVFGSRAGLEMQKLLGKTTEELEEFAQGAYDAGLVLSDDGVKAAEEYRLALDGMNDSFEGLKMQIGEEFLPVFKAAVDAMNEGISTAKQNAERIDNIREAYQKGYITLEEYREATEGLKQGQWEYNETAQRASELIDSLEAAMSDTTLETGALRNVTVDELIPAIKEVGEVAEETGEIIEVDLTGELDNLKLFISGPLGDEIDNFNVKQGELKTEASKVAEEIAKLEGKKYLTAAQKTELETLRTKYGEITTAIGEEATAHDEATKKILFNLLSQRAAMDGLTSHEMELLNNVALSWGLIDQATFEAVGTIDDALGTLATSENSDLAQAYIDELANKWNSIEDKSINLIVSTSVSGPAAGLVNSGGIGDQIQTFASGGQFVTSGPQLILVGEAGPEAVSVTPLSGSGQTVTNNWNINMMTNAPVSTIGRDLQMLSARAV